MFIRLANFHNGECQRFNINNIVTYGKGTNGGKDATYIETVNQTDPNATPYFVRETPKQIDELIFDAECEQARRLTNNG